MPSDFFPELMARYRLDEDDTSPMQDTGYEAQLKYWCNAAFEEADTEQSKSQPLNDMTKYIDYLTGKQWAGGRPSYRAKPVNNRMVRLFWESVGMLTDIRPIIGVKATDRTEPFLTTEKILNDCTFAWSLNTDYDMKLALCVMYGMLTTAFAKYQWNPELNMGQGDLEMVPLSPESLMALNAKDTLQSAEALIYKEIVPLNWIKRKFPSRAFLVKPDQSLSLYEKPKQRPGQVAPMLFEMLSPQMQRLVAGDNKIEYSVFPKVQYREYWIKDPTMNTSNARVYMGRPRHNYGYWVEPGAPLYPRGRVICMAGGEIMEDDVNPYWHGQFPFAMLRLNAVPWQFHGMPPMRSWIDLQDIVNQIYAGVMDMIKLAVNPRFLAPKTAFSDDVWSKLDWSKPGERAAYSANAPSKPDFAPAPNLPPFVLQMLSMTERDMDLLSGVAAVGEAVRKKQIPSGDTLDQIKQTQQTPTRLQGRNIEMFIRDGGKLHVSNMLQFYDAKRRYAILGQAGLSPVDYDSRPGSLVPAGMPEEEHARMFHFYIEPGSLLNLKRYEQMQEAVKMRAMGDMSRRGLYRIIDRNIDVDQIEKELLAERQAGLGGAPPKGKGGKK